MYLGLFCQKQLVTCGLRGKGAEPFYSHQNILDFSPLISLFSSATKPGIGSLASSEWYYSFWPPHGRAPGWFPTFWRMHAHRRCPLPGHTVPRAGATAPQDRQGCFALPTVL